MLTLSCQNINEAQLEVLKLLLGKGSEVVTRGYKTLEISPIAFVVSNPLDRITTLKGRHWKFASAIGELTWHLSGSNDVNFISNYLRQWAGYSPDGISIIG